jgi:hypothetical protein
MITGVIRKKGNTILAGVYLAIVTIALFILFRSWSYDDPFITYRYADNLHRGLGFVYNPGQQVLSTTTPLFTILLAVMEGLWGDLPTLANLIGAFSLALGGLFCWTLARAWGPPTAGYFALLLYPTFPLLLTTLGSEMPLYLALCLGTILFYTRTNYSLASVFAAFAVLARPDGVLVAIILACDYLIRVRRRIPWLGVGLFLGLTMPWMLFAWLYFGSPVPSTPAAKQQ